MAIDPTWALHVAVVEALTPALAPVPVLDHVPPGQEYPYVTISDTSMLPEDDKTEDGFAVTFTLQAWQRAEGGDDVRGSYTPKRLIGLAYRRLHKATDLQVAGHTVWSVRVETTQFFPDADPHVTRGIARVRCGLVASS